VQVTRQLSLLLSTTKAADFVFCFMQENLLKTREMQDCKEVGKLEIYEMPANPQFLDLVSSKLVFC
jgi:hypothetical protein